MKALPPRSGRSRTLLGVAVCCTVMLGLALLSAGVVTSDLEDIRGPAPGAPVASFTRLAAFEDEPSGPQPHRDCGPSCVRSLTALVAAAAPLDSAVFWLVTALPSAAVLLAAQHTLRSPAPPPR